MNQSSPKRAPAGQQRDVQWVSNHMALQQYGYWYAFYRRNRHNDWHCYQDRGAPAIFLTKQEADQFLAQRKKGSKQ